MKADLENYTPPNPEYILSDKVREEFPLELDFLNAVQSEKLETKRDVMKFIGRTFTATFPETEYVTRVMDDFEKRAIREEYNDIVETRLPMRKRELEEALEEAKRMKKEAEERYAAALQELYSFAAEVRQGTMEVRLRGSDTFRIALAGYYLTYTWNDATQTFVLAKGEEIADASELWSDDAKNREMMLTLWGVELPYPEETATGDADADF